MFWWTQSLTIQTTCIVKLINWDVLHRKKRWYHGDKGWNSCALLFGPKLHIWFTWHTLFYSAFWNSIFLLMQLLLIKIIAKLCTCVLYRLLWSKSSKIVLIKYTNRIQRMVLRCPISNDINCFSDIVFVCLDAHYQNRFKCTLQNIYEDKVISWTRYIQRCIVFLIISDARVTTTRSGFRGYE